MYDDSDPRKQQESRSWGMSPPVRGVFGPVGPLPPRASCGSEQICSRHSSSAHLNSIFLRQAVCEHFNEQNKEQVATEAEPTERINTTKAALVGLGDLREVLDDVLAGRVRGRVLVHPAITSRSGPAASTEL
jgi:hypothetical protein